MTIDCQKLLRGRYEAERLPADFSPERIVPDFTFNVLNPLGLLYRPVVDEKYLQNGGQKPIWPYGKSFAVCLTHDVDFVSLDSFRQAGRALFTQLATADSWINGAKAILNAGLNIARIAKNVFRQDPLHCYEYWLKAEDKVGARSTFFFWPGAGAISKYHRSDCTYDLTDPVVFDKQKCTVTEMIREINRQGWEIGLHSSWYSFNDANELKRQKEALEKALGREIVSVRQHFLHHDIRITPQVQSEAGFKYDSTLGFNDNIGFRFGTCYPWQLYDLMAAKELPIMEIPLIVQDGAMLNPVKGMRLDANTAFRYIKQLAEAVEKVGGVLTLLWHPNSVIKPDWWNLYLQALDYLNKKDAWFGTIGAIGKHIHKINETA